MINYWHLTPKQYSILWAVRNMDQPPTYAEIRSYVDLYISKGYTDLKQLPKVYPLIYLINRDFLKVVDGNKYELDGMAMEAVTYYGVKPEDMDSMR
jgi:hypothetical protein